MIKAFYCQNSLNRKVIDMPSKEKSYSSQTNTLKQKIWNLSNINVFDMPIFWNTLLYLKQ